jgi:MFS family permease
MTQARQEGTNSRWAALRSPRFRFLAAGSLAQAVGDYFYAVALPWYVLSQHGSPVLLGTVLAAYGIPRVAFISIGGQLSDRLSPWAIMFTAGAGRALLVGGLAFIAAISRPSAVTLVPLAAAIGAGEGLALPAYFSAVPALLGSDELQGGNSLLSLVNQCAALVGPALGGAVVAAVGPVSGFSVDAASFAISAVTVWWIRARSVRSPIGKQDRPGLRIWSFLRHERIVPLLLLTTFIANLGGGGLIAIALPVFVRSTLGHGASVYGLLISSFAAGAVTGVLAATRLPSAWRPAVALASAFAIEGGLFAALAFASVPIVAAVVLAGAGVCNGFANVTQQTLFQHWAPPDMLGRISSLLLTAGYGSYPISVAVAGLVVLHFSAAAFFLAAGISLAAVEIAALSQTTWRSWGSATRGIVESDAAAPPAEQSS